MKTYFIEPGDWESATGESLPSGSDGIAVVPLSALKDAYKSNPMMLARAFEEAWELLERQRSGVAKSFKGADHATGERGANFAYMGYVMAMDKLRYEARKICE